ncbi:hypothetical protein QNI19_02160 [Cytophagaceae bacterium DM2B3-1]|uniref:Glycosyltransferase n=1 Tax=Xanthocytophaga flava TaxID=3048013 RepID=A0ABT7CDF7_9BACT|nr:hypothetical protein [Xanthocytophaga flavus]MDJ1491716.1 hypothetical protein [Xanthocytophaga flavus]
MSDLNLSKQYLDDALLQLCGDEGLEGLKQYTYWPAEIYGMGKHIREYGFYPSNWPIHIMTDHSPTLRNWISFDNQFDAPVQFYHSPELVKEWKKQYKKPCYVIFSPFAFYRKKNRIKQSTTAVGTLVFPTHNSHHLKDKSDIESYIQQLLSLPDEFQPISACLYFLDILDGKHKLFQKYNIPVYTAGNWLDPKFTERFYNIIKNFKYTTSNLPGSYLFYSVEMGIPFFLYGNKPQFENESDSSIELGSYDAFWQWPRVKEAVELFQGVHIEVTPAQRDWVETGLGIRDGISRFKMARILYSTWYKYEYKASKKNNMMPSLLVRIKKKVKRLMKSITE